MYYVKELEKMAIEQFARGDRVRTFGKRAIGTVVQKEEIGAWSALLKGVVILVDCDDEVQHSIAVNKGR